MNKQLHDGLTALAAYDAAQTVSATLQHEATVNRLQQRIADLEGKIKELHNDLDAAVANAVYFDDRLQKANEALAAARGVQAPDAPIAEFEVLAVRDEFKNRYFAAFNWTTQTRDRFDSIAGTHLDALDGTLVRIVVYRCRLRAEDL